MRICSKKESHWVNHRKQKILLPLVCSVQCSCIETNCSGIIRFRLQDENKTTEAKRRNARGNKLERTPALLPGRSGLGREAGYRGRDALVFHMHERQGEHEGGQLQPRLL